MVPGAADDRRNKNVLKACRFFQWNSIRTRLVDVAGKGEGVE
jgi:hypothetical protein